MGKYNVVLCEIHNKYMHGFDDASDPSVKGHFLVIERVDSIFFPQDQERDEDYNEYNVTILEEYIQFQMYKYINARNRSSGIILCHDNIRNYRNIIRRSNYIKPEIAECIYLSGDECVAIIKTFWIKIIQRTWKKIFKERKQNTLNRMKLCNLKYIEIHGKWSLDCRLPTIHGMLRDMM
jgi:hypothetical protein